MAAVTRSIPVCLSLGISSHKGTLPPAGLSVVIERMTSVPVGRYPVRMATARGDMAIVLSLIFLEREHGDLRRSKLVIVVSSRATLQFRNISYSPY